MNLNLCSEYKITPDTSIAAEGECVGKREIDSASYNKVIPALGANVTVWERFSENSVWRFMSITTSQPSFDILLKQKNIPLNIRQQTSYNELISYTYRF